jgi:DNA-directed RNA polymerase subunit RPC12/RpoP
MKEKANYCMKCGKELSKSERKSNNTKCENCIGKQAKKTKGIMVGVGSVVGTALGIGLFIITRGRKGKF